MVMIRKPLRITRRAPTPGFLRAWGTVRGLALVWAEFVGATVLVSMLNGPIALLSFMAALLTIALPIASLTLWGVSLDKELGWTERDEGS